MKIIKNTFGFSLIRKSLFKKSSLLTVAASVAFAVALSGCSSDEVVRVASPETERQISQGTVTGFEGDYNNHAWYGIPFAKAPVGELRWKAPVAAEEFSNGHLTAIEHGAACTQMAGTLGGVPGEKGTVGGSEDCLYLSIYAPKMTKEDASDKQKQLPVMVWVHGGSNKSGTGAMYDGSRLAAEQNVIVVSINYRLGPFGWFKHPALNLKNSEQSSEQELSSSGNYGTLDIIQSLKWVKQNIAGFGGNGNNVTLFGESAGGYDTYSLLLSPIAKGLFHKAISQSGGLNLTRVDVATNYIEDGGHKYSSQQAELYAYQLLSKDKTAEQLKEKIAEQTAGQRAKFLMGLSAQSVMDAYQYDKIGRASCRERV